MPAGLVWPTGDERKLLARFYVALGLSRALYLIAPFEFAYLYLVMDRPEWSVMPLVALSATSLLMQLPAGALADRWSRKAIVLLGGAVSAGTYVAVPWAVRLDGTVQLVGTCAAFALVGLGLTLMAGAQEAWVVDNLRYADREDLVEEFFARTYVVQALGGVLAGILAVILLLTLHVDRGLLDVLWYATAVGFLAAVAVASSITERRLPSDRLTVKTGVWAETRAALRVLVRTRPLLMLSVAIMIAALSSAAADEAFPISLLTKGFDARGLAPLGIADDLLGMAAPLVGLFLARRIGAERLLARTLVFSGAVVALLFVTRSIGVLVALYVVLGFADRMWDPVALARIQRDIPSMHRATINSVVYQVNGLAQVVGLAMLGLLLGRHSGALREATPDLVDAFTGRAQPVPDVPTSLLGLPVPDLAIVLFVGAAVVAVPFIVLARRAGGGTAPPAPSRPRHGPGRALEAPTGADFRP